MIEAKHLPTLTAMHGFGATISPDAPCMRQVIVMARETVYNLQRPW